MATSQHTESSEAALALRQQLERARGPFIAIHDVATRSSRKLLGGVAAASQRAVQSFAIQRPTDGTTLATLEFVDLPTAEGHNLRVYSTQADGDEDMRSGVARTLLAFSTLGVLFVGEAAPTSIAGLLAPLHDQMVAGPWPNRHLLLLPLSTGNALVAQAMELARDTGVDVRTTPQVARPADAWNFISSTWSRLRGPGVETGSGSTVSGGHTMPGGAARGTPAQGRMPATRPAPGATLPSSMPSVPSPMPTQPARSGVARPPVVGAGDILGRYVEQLSRLAGMVSCCIFDVATGDALLHAGGTPGAHALAEHGAELLAAMLTSSRTLGLGHAMPEAAITLGAHHLVLRAVPRHAGLALHAVLDKDEANLTLARLQIARMDALFDASPGG